MTRGIVLLLSGLLCFGGCQPRAANPLHRAPGGAADVIRDYYRAIDARDYEKAYRIWAQGGEASGQTLQGFVDGFRRTAHVEVEIQGPVRTEGAAGSIYAEVAVVVRARTTAGQAQRFQGTYTLRRVNDVPGATPEQLRWHIVSAKLTPAT